MRFNLDVKQLKVEPTLTRLSLGQALSQLGIPPPNRPPHLPDGFPHPLDGLSSPSGFEEKCHPRADGPNVTSLSRVI